ncbi:MAG: O-antigen ligase family protein [Bacteroidota bacterium]|nr:O-antigen ligase family protein [Bacteroidota bacterium]
MQLSKSKQILFYTVSLIFLAANLFLIYKNIYYLSFLPLVLIFIAYNFISLDKILLTITFFTPLSITLSYFIPDIGFNLSLPTEPLLIGVFLLFIYKLLLDGKFDKKVLLHPISIAIYINFFWLFLTSLTSTLPLVSFKFLLSRLWYITVFYFLGTQVFKNPKNIDRFIFLFTAALLLVITYNIYRLSGYGLDNQHASNFVIQPFFPDHTSYGAILVMFFFPLVGFVFRKDLSLFAKTNLWIILLYISFAITISYTRAAWLSLIAAIAFWGILKLKIKLRTIIITISTIVIIAFVFQNQILYQLEGNDIESSGNFAEHIESMANISTDASNLERINRWKCAIRMFKEKPFWGWGPGTYMFNYAPFQFSYEKTIISTDFGNMGNAHSEYLGPLAESGILGTLTFIVIVALVISTGIRVYKTTNTKKNKILALTILLALSSYFAHGLLNNFLDTDKASVPFWGFIGILVALDVNYKKEEKTFYR